MILEYYKHLNGTHIVYFGDDLDYFESEIRSWCVEMFDKELWHDTIEYGDVEFINKEDAMMFLLKWS
jgi:hypothetical protein